MLKHLVRVCLALLPFAQCIQIHKHMTQEEVRKTFQTEHDNVPEYEIVRLYHTLHKRDINKNSAQTMKFKALGRALSLYLEPTEGLLVGEWSPVWTAKGNIVDPNQPQYIWKRNILKNIGQAYQDLRKRSAIVAYKGEDGETLVHGNLLEDLIVRPLPHRLHNTILRETRDLVDILPDGVDGEADFQRSHHHVIFKKPRRGFLKQSRKHFRDCIRKSHHLQYLVKYRRANVVEREKRSFAPIANNRSERSIPDIVYPEVLIIVDHSLYTAIGKNVEDAVRYILAFWNGVDLRYRLVKEPVIRLNIAAIIVSLEPFGTPYLENSKSGSTKLNAPMAIRAMGHYFYRESFQFPFANYDFIVAMTNLNLCEVGTNGVCDIAMLGQAIKDGACQRNHFTRVTENVAIVEDNGGYKGITTTAHEVAHLMGVAHDGTQEAADCPDSDKYLMASSEYYDENAFHFSECSLEQLYDFLSGPQSICLRDKPPTSKALPRVLPGQLLTLDEQCEKFKGTKACYYDERVCTVLKCYKSPSSIGCEDLAPAAEGSSCGNEMHCINGYCVSKKMTRVPYTPIYRRNKNAGNKNLRVHCQGYYPFGCWVSYPGVSYPGVSYPGVSYPGVSYPGVSYPGVSYPGAFYPGVFYPGGSISGK